MRKIVIRCSTVMNGVVEGEALVTRQPLCLYDSLDPKSGLIVNRRHELCGQNVSGKIFVFPHGTGSSTTAATILEASRRNKAPKAIVNLETEPVIAVGAVLAEKLYGNIIPIVDKPDKNPMEFIDNGDLVRVDANSGTIEITKTQAKPPGRKRSN